jgi:translation initiation factor eIF-2B subunit alpha
MDAIMNAPVHHILYELIRAYMDALGTSRTTIVALKSYMNAIRKLKCPPEAFGPLISELSGVIKNTEPKVIPLIHLIEEFDTEMVRYLDSPITEAKKRAIEILGRKLDRFEKDTLTLTRLCMDHIVPGDFIAVHSATAYIRNALVQARMELQRPFKVLTLKQDFQRTRDLVSALDQHNVEYVLIPEDNLSHYLKSVSKLFVGAVSITSDNHAVTGIGTANVISLCHYRQVPVYLFAESLKFAHQPLFDQHIHQEGKDRVESDFTFRMTTFSHDVVPLQMIDHLITEKGEKHL